MRKTLSEIPGIGRVFICKSCSRIHFTFGRLTLDMDTEEFLGFKELVQNAAQNMVEETLKVDKGISISNQAIAGLARLN